MTVFDLYSGTGTISQILSPVAKKVIGVEIVEEAVQAAKENAELNGIDNCRFFAGDVLKVIDEIEEKPSSCWTRREMGFILRRCRRLWSMGWRRWFIYLVSLVV